MLIGYVRPRAEDADCTAQKAELLKFGDIEVYQEAHASAKKRIELEAMLVSLQKEDVVLVERLFILADSSRQLLETLQQIEEKGAFLRSLKEGIDTGSAEGYAFREIVQHLVEFQSDVISEKTKRGLDQAKQKGVSSGRPRKPDENVQRAIEMYESKNYSLAEIKEETGISKSTLYRYLES